MQRSTVPFVRLLKSWRCCAGVGGVSEVTLRCFFILRRSNVVLWRRPRYSRRVSALSLVVTPHSRRVLLTLHAASLMDDSPARMSYACGRSRVLDYARPCRWAVSNLSFANKAGTILRRTIPVGLWWLVSLAVYVSVQYCTVCEVPEHKICGVWAGTWDEREGAVSRGRLKCGVQCAMDD